MSCYRTSNNKYSDAPPRMADGRHFTDYRPSCDLNNVINRDNNINNSFEARVFLQRNATKLMDLNKGDACLRNCSRECGADVNDDINEGFESTMLPEKFKQFCNGSTCEYKLNNEDGLGLGREYFTEEHRNKLNMANANHGKNDCREENQYLNVEGYPQGPELYDIRTAP